MLYSTLSDMAYDIVGDNSTSPVYFTYAEMRGFINSAYAKMVAATRCIEARKIQTVVAGTSEYTFPADCMNVMRVAVDGERLTPVTQQRIRARDDRWRDKTGAPEAYYLDGLSRNSFGLYPNPSATYETFALTSEYGGLHTVPDKTPTSEYGFWADADYFDTEYGVLMDAGTGGMEIIYEAQAIQLTGDSDQPRVPEWASYGIVWGALELAFKANTDLRNSEASVLYGSAFLRVVRRLKMRVNSKLPRVWSKETHEKEPVGPIEGIRNRLSEVWDI